MQGTFSGLTLCGGTGLDSRECRGDTRGLCRAGIMPKSGSGGSMRFSCDGGGALLA